MKRTKSFSSLFLAALLVSAILAGCSGMKNHYTPPEKQNLADATAVVDEMSQGARRGEIKFDPTVQRYWEDRLGFLTSTMYVLGQEYGIESGNYLLARVRVASNDIEDMRTDLVAASKTAGKTWIDKGSISWLGVPLWGIGVFAFAAAAGLALQYFGAPGLISPLWAVAHWLVNRGSSNSLIRAVQGVRSDAEGLTLGGLVARFGEDATLRASVLDPLLANNTDTALKGWIDKRKQIMALPGAAESAGTIVAIPSPARPEPVEGPPPAPPAAAAPADTPPAPGQPT